MDSPEPAWLASIGGAKVAAKLAPVRPIHGSEGCCSRCAARRDTSRRSTVAELGETAVAAYLKKRTARGPAVLLHDRRMPGGYGNIDHLAIAPNGVFVIDAKNVKGKVRVANPLFGAAKLMIRGRDSTKLIDGLDRQVHAVRRALMASGHPSVPVQGVLCFVSADLPSFGTLKIRGHCLLHRRALAKRLNKGGPLQSPAIDLLARALAGALPSA